MKTILFTLLFSTLVFSQEICKNKELNLLELNSLNKCGTSIKDTLSKKEVFYINISARNRNKYKSRKNLFKLLKETKKDTLPN